METCFIANVGQRDLMVEGKACQELAPDLAAKLNAARAGEHANVRAWSRLIQANYETLRPCLRAPMLSAALGEVAKLNEPLGGVVLVGTKQEDKQFLGGDTFICAEVLARLLKDTHGDFLADTAVRVEVVTPPPHDLNAMLMEAYPAIVDRLKAERLFALCTGGTPACNMALTLRATERFGTHCTILYVPEGSQAAERLGVGRYLLARERRHTLERLIARRDFDAVAGDPGYAPEVRGLARAAAARMNLDFSTSLAELEKQASSVKESGMNRLVQEGRALAGKRKDALLREVYWNAVIKWRRNECADFLGRAWRLCETSLQHAVARLAGLPEKQLYENFRDWAETQPEDFMQYLEEHLIGKKRSLHSITASVPALMCTLGYFIKKRPGALKPLGITPEQAHELRQSLNMLRPLTDLRNQSIIAHGFQGLSKEDIMEKVRLKRDENRLLQCLRHLLSVQGIDAGDDPYDVFATILLEMDSRATR